MPITIVSGGTLWDAAQRLLGDGSRWKELLAPSGLPSNFNPVTLQIGTVIRTAAEVQAAAKPKAAPKPAASPSSQSVPVQPGLQAEQFADRLALEEFLANLAAELTREAQADVRRLQEAQLGANPGDFVALELYRRSLEEEGFDPTTASRSDEDIQDLFSMVLGLEGIDGEFLGEGRFGVHLPSSTSISRSQFGDFDATDLGILSSFLSGGIEGDEGAFLGINPEDYFRELEEGLVPTLAPQRTQFRF